MEFRILGSLTVRNGSADLTPTAPKLRQVLALLVLRHNQLVQTEALIDELWGEDPPQSALSTLQTYIYKLRKLFAEESGNGSGGILVTKPAGYIAMVPAEDIDACCFERMAAQGRHLMDAGDADEAAEVLAGALALWRGPALADVATGDLLAAHVTRLEELRLTMLELRCEADMQLGRHRELISELKALAAAHPFHEGFHGKLMLALLRAGRRGEGLEVYQRLRRMLVQELGVEPSASIQRLQQSLLESGPVAEPPRIPPPRPAGITVVPAQLPPDTGDFVGREQELKCIIHGTVPGDDIGTAVRPTLITGMPGVGKTTLAIRAGHLIKSGFPGGQFFADLHGSGQSPADPALVLKGFLSATDLSASQIPEGLEERTKLFRTWTASHRALIVLDDAASAVQVQPLLPGSAECGVIVTSRTALPGLAGSQLIELATLSLDQGVQMLANIAGPGRVMREINSAEQIVRMCGFLPLALRSVGARIATMWAFPLYKIVHQLGGSWTRLSELTHAEYDVTASFERSYRLLHATEQSAFRVLSLLHESDFTALRASALLGRSSEATEELLGRLVENHLLQMVGCRPTGEVSYAFHELARLFAKARLAEMLHVESHPDLMAGRAILRAEDNAAVSGAGPARRP